MITGCGQREDHAGIARAVLGSRGSGLSAERDAPPWCCVLLNRTAANAQLNGRGPAGPGGGRVHGAQVTGRSYAQPGAARRAALAAWAAALGIRLGDEYHQDSRMTTITGPARRPRPAQP